MFIIFSGNTYYPRGGLNDLQTGLGPYSDLDDALHAVAAHNCDWWQIVSLELEDGGMWIEQECNGRDYMEESVNESTGPFKVYVGDICDKLLMDTKPTWFFNDYASALKHVCDTEGFDWYYITGSNELPTYAKPIMRK